VVVVVVVGPWYCEGTSLLDELETTELETAELEEIELDTTDETELETGD
jgi:hypothetical protein